MSLKNTFDIFVPGRLCLFGEHSDWAGEYRKHDPGLEKGYCIIAGTDQGIHASAEAAESGFHVSQILPNGQMSSETAYRNFSEAELAAGQPGNFHAYAAGTASIIMRDHPEKGLKLKVYRRTLPLKKGLSSSAAVCVATARAFNTVHSMELTTAEEMEIAYRGELLTGSHCGRMDQACAHGGGPVLMTFDGDRFEIRKLKTGKRLFILIADLGGKKNTRKILSDLNECFRRKNSGIREALGSENHCIIRKACAAMESGDAEELGRLMNRAQEVFDELVAPCSPEELTAPVLHRVLELGRSTGLVYGGKGVGSQGDGTAQFLCRGEEQREELAGILNELSGVKCYYLTI